MTSVKSFLSAHILNKSHLLFVLIVSTYLLLTGCTLSNQSQTVSWPEQLTRIEEVAHQHNTSGVLINFLTSLDDETISRFLTKAVIDSQVRCTYVLPNGETYSLSYETNNIYNTLQVNTQEFGSVAPFTQEYYDKLQQLPATLRIGPIDALREAQAEAQDFFSQADTRVGIIVGLHTHPEIQEKYAVLAAWSVLMMSESRSERRVWIDAQSGTILDVENWKESSE